MKMWRLILSSCLCDQTWQCRRRTKHWVWPSPHPGAICHQAVQSSEAPVWAQSRGVCTQAHHCVCAHFFAPPLFVRQLHIPCSKDFPRQDSAQPEREGELPTTFLQHPTTAPLSTLKPVWGAGHFPLSSSLLFCHKTESRQSLSPPVPKKLQSTDAR